MLTLLHAAQQERKAALDRGRVDTTFQVGDQGGPRSCWAHQRAGPAPLAPAAAPHALPPPGLFESRIARIARRQKAAIRAESRGAQ